MANLLTVLSLLAFVGVVALWVLGYFGINDAGWYVVRWPDADHRERREWALRSVAGHFVLIGVDNDFNFAFAGEISTGMRRPEDVEAFRRTDKAGRHAYWRRMDAGLGRSMRRLGPGTQPMMTPAEFLAMNVPRHNRLGFGYQVETSANRGRHDVYRQLTIPAWLPALLTAAAPTAWLARHLRRRRRLARGLCPACGYDLRATPGRCPECGAAPRERNNPPRSAVA